MSYYDDWVDRGRDPKKKKQKKPKPDGQRIPLASDLFQDAVAGRKTMTIRLGARVLGHKKETRLGRAVVYDATGTKELPVCIWSVSLYTVSNLPLPLLEAEGYGSREEAFEKIKRHYNSDLTPESVVTVIQWQEWTQTTGKFPQTSNTAPEGSTTPS